MLRLVTRCMGRVLASLPALGQVLPESYRVLTGNYPLCLTSSYCRHKIYNCTSLDGLVLLLSLSIKKLKSI